MYTRRTVLGHVAGLGGTPVLTGCLIWDVSNDSSLSIHLTPVSRTELEPTGTPTLDELEPRARAAVTGGTTVYGRKPLEEGAYVLANGSYYTVHVEQNGTETVDRPVLEAEEVSEPDGSVGGWEMLNPSDDFTLRCAIQAPDRVYEPPCVVHGGSHSAFWPELQFEYLEIGTDRYFRLRTSEQTVTLDRHDYTVERVARNRSAFVDHVVDQRVDVDFSAIDLSAEQRDILETAAAEGVYRESPPYSDALERLEDRVPRVGGDPAYVRFNGSYYEAHTEQVYDD